jgi:LAS superfamily LD-carboxypeptidase LdcB
MNKKYVIIFSILICIISSCSSPSNTNNSIEVVPKESLLSFSETENEGEIETVKNKEEGEIEIISQIKERETLSEILGRYNVSQKTILIIAEQKEVDCDFNNMQIGKEYKISLDADSVITSFHYQKNSENVYSITFSDPIKYKETKTTIKKVISDKVIIKEEVKMEEKVNKEISKSDFLTGKFQLNKHPNFVLVDKKYHTKSEMYLQKETLEDFIKMKESAEKDGIQLILVSGTRNFYSQKSIWERKYNKNKAKGLTDIENIKKIMIWSSMPSTSRHHWGTDIDINGFDEYFDGKNEKANNEYEWLVNNASKFGFCQVYSEKEEGKRQTGYNEEKWHWSYMPLSSNYLKMYKELITYKDINGFSASEFAKELDIIKAFVFGISKECN